MASKGGLEGVMNVEVARRPGVTPESDCNSNNLPGDVSLCSNSSMDFLQDNCDYQWFLECGYRDQSNLQKSILSGYYDELSKNLDANLAEVEMEDFQSRDIHSILSTLQGLEEREMFASVSGSMMVKFDFDSSISPHSTSQEAATSMCRSGPLFSPLRQECLPVANLSVDSLDLSDDMNLLITCQANKNNYTIAFEGSTVMESDSDLLDNERLANNKSETTKTDNNGIVRSDSMYTTWSQLKQQSRGSDNGNSGEETGKSLSLPDLCSQQRPCMKMSVSSKLSSETGSSESAAEHRTTVKLFDIQNVNHKSALSDSAASTVDKSGKPKNFSLVKLFMKQKGNSDTMEQSSASDCWPDANEINVKSDSRQNIRKSTHFNINNNNSFGSSQSTAIDKACQTDGKHPVYLVYPNYTLPDLNFIKENHNVGNIDLSQMFVGSQKYRGQLKSNLKIRASRRRPVSMDDMESLRKKGLRHVQDWPSLTFLLPKECKEFLEGIPEIVSQLKDVQKPLFNVGTSGSSGYRGSSIMLNSNTSDEIQSRAFGSGKFSCKTAKETANMRRLEELLEISSVFGDSSDEVTQEDIKKLRHQIGKFLSMQKELEKVTEKLSANESFCLEEGCRKGLNFRSSTPPNSPTISNLTQQKSTHKKKILDIPIDEESEPSTEHPSYSLSQKKDLVKDVIRATKLLTRTAESLGDTAAVCLQYFCPALYALMSDGLRDTLDTPFGPITNSVWAVVEASTGQAPAARALNELVMRLNREMVLNEPLLKFNAFIFGLLNVRAVEGWLTFLRTQDSLLHKYYDNRGIFLLANTMGLVRCMLDHMVDSLKPLSDLQLNLDLLHQARQLHRSLSNINSLLEATPTENLLSPSKHLLLLTLLQQKSEQPSSDQRKPRPRSGCEMHNVLGGSGAANRKRWSGVQLNSRLSRAFQRLGEAEGECELDSLEACKRLQMSDDTSEDVSSAWTGPSSPSRHNNSRETKRNILSSLNKKITGAEFSGRKFKKLQQRWEQLSGQPDSSISPLSSPEHQPSPVHAIISETDNHCDTTATTRNRKQPQASTKVITTPSPTSRLSRIPRLVTSPVRPQSSAPALPSQIPTLNKPDPPPKRPTTLPYRRAPSTSIPSPHSLSLNRPRPSTSAVNTTRLRKQQKTVRTITHRLSRDSGHLSFNVGERLKVVLEVDDTYLLCCSGNRKGLVPRACVIALPDSIRV